MQEGRRSSEPAETAESQTTPRKRGDELLAFAASAAPSPAKKSKWALRQRLLLLLSTFFLFFLAVVTACAWLAGRAPAKQSGLIDAELADVSVSAPELPAAVAGQQVPPIIVLGVPDVLLSLCVSLALLAVQTALRVAWARIRSSLLSKSSSGTADSPKDARPSCTQAAATELLPGATSPSSAPRTPTRAVSRKSGDLPPLPPPPSSGKKVALALAQEAGFEGSYRNKEGARRSARAAVLRITM
jgi:hypothetical protein